jgi:hypothetical protein
MIVSGLRVFLAGLFRVFIDPGVDALHEGVGETRLDGAGAPGFEDGDVDFLILGGAARPLVFRRDRRGARWHQGGG